MRVVAKIQMEKWNGDVLDMNETVQRLGPRKCSQLLGIHALSGCDTVSYPFGKGKNRAQSPRYRYIRSRSSASVSLARRTLSSRIQHRHSSYPSTDRRDVQQ